MRGTCIVLLLTLSSVAAADALDAQVDQLVKDMNRSIAEADKFIQSMEKETD